MSIPEKFSDALRQEFGCYYEVSELPDSWEEWLLEELEDAARTGAARMRYWVDNADIPELIAFLRAESQNRQGSLVKEVEHWTRAYWRGDDENWMALQRILNSIANQLEASSQ